MPKPDYPTERVYTDEREDTKRAAKQILGPDTFKRRDRRGLRLGPDISEGAGAALALRSDRDENRPYAIARAFQGARTRDIELPTPTKPITKPRSMRGGKR